MSQHPLSDLPASVRRHPPLPATAPVALTGQFAGDPEKERQWRSFLQRNRLQVGEITLAQIIDELHSFLGPVLEITQQGCDFTLSWQPRGPWTAEPLPNDKT